MTDDVFGAKREQAENGKVLVEVLGVKVPGNYCRTISNILARAKDPWAFRKAIGVMLENLQTHPFFKTHDTTTFKLFAEQLRETNG